MTPDAPRTPPRLRSATPDDADALASVHRSAILHGCVGSYRPVQIKAWLEVLDRDVYPQLMETAYVRIAELDGATAGFAVTTLRGGLINAVYVAPFATNQGVGSALVADAEEALLTAGQLEARLNATLNSVDFYRWLGYEDVTETINRLPGGVAMACVAMRKRLV